ncbi:MAG: hypothetical protein AB7O28_20295 [Vicinamibacterales bacterium]
MNLTTVAIGLAAIGYGLYTAWARRARPVQLKKLDAMKHTWGEAGGHVVHVIGYTVVPIVVGVALVLSGLRGGSVF